MNFISLIDRGVSSLSIFSGMSFGGLCLSRSVVFQAPAPWAHGACRTVYRDRGGGPFICGVAGLFFLLLLLSLAGDLL